MKSRTKFGYLSVAVVLGGLMAAGSFAQDDKDAAAEDEGAKLASLTFTSPQATGGGANYQRSCASCHGNELEGTAGPALSGVGFSHWIGEPVSGLHEFIQNYMPPQSPNSLSDAQVATIIAYIAQGNGMVAGDEPMSTDPVELEEVAFEQYESGKDSSDE